MKNLYFSFLVLLLSNVLNAQNQPPVAIQDTVEAISQIPVIIDALANDYDPDGDSIYIVSASSFEGEAYIENGKVVFMPTNEIGNSIVRYSVSDGISTNSHGFALVHVMVNPDAPMAVADTFELLNMMEHTVSVFGNDFDPNNDQFKIGKLETSTLEPLIVTVNPDSMSFSVTPLLGFKGKFSYYITEKNTSTGYSSPMVKVYVNFIQNPDIPEINPDFATGTGGMPIQIDVLANDIDHQGDNIAVKDLFNQVNGSYENNGNSITFTPSLSFAGKTIFRYNIQEVDDPLVYSDTVTVTVNVQKNPDCPVGVIDHASGMTAVEMEIDVLANDFDPNGDAIIIKDVSKGTITADNKILYKSQPLTLTKDSLQYRVMEASNQSSWSEWTTVYIDLAINPDLPVANPDYASTKAGVPVTIFPSTNDEWNSYDSLKIIVSSTGLAKKGKASFSGDTAIYIPAFQAEGIDSIFYYIRSGYELLAKGMIYINISKQYYYDSLNINNINAGVNASGFLFAKHWEIHGISYNYDITPHFKTPVSGQPSTIFSNTLWVGGYDQQNNLHLSSEMYQQSSDQNSIHWQSGPVSSVYDTGYLSKSARLWKLLKSEIEFHRQNYNQSGYEPVEAIRTWPGNGNTNLGQHPQLAPYYDLNNDGLYNCLDGDYPLIRGDQTIYFIFNDDTPRAEPANPLKIEVHCMVYGFDAPEDTALNNTVFVHYDLINRSQETYTNCLAGIYTDFEIGNYKDDYLRCDVGKGSSYAYNGDENDEYDPVYGQPEIPTYGDNPPAQSVTVLAGPFMDSDGIDNPAGGCNESINGLNFGNQVPDDERSGLARFIYFTRQHIGPYWEYPLTELQLYNYMNGMWEDSTHFLYGGNSHPEANAVGPACRYMFPGDSDPLNYGTNCEFPNGGYNQGTKFWTEEETGNNPGDRRGLGTLGPFTLTPGQVQEIDLAYVVGHGTNGVTSSVNQLLRNIDSLLNKVASGNLLIPNNLLGLAPEKASKPLLIYPNPANEIITLTGLNPGSRAEYSIFNLYGTCMSKGTLQSSTRPVININMLPAGMYLIRVSGGSEVSVGKFIKNE